MLQQYRGTIDGRCCRTMQWGCSGVQWHRHTMFDDMVGCTGGSTQCTGGDRLGGMVVLRSDIVSGRCWKQHGNTGTG